MIPNAASFINQGYNPLSFSEGFDKHQVTEIMDLCKDLGECPIVDEEKLEAYAIITAMGPTYLWPQLHQLHQLGLQFGLTEEEAASGIQNMLNGTKELLNQTEINYDQVIDLIPVKPMHEHIENLCKDYQSTLTGLYKKLKRAN